MPLNTLVLVPLFWAAVGWLTGRSDRALVLLLILAHYATAVVSLWLLSYGVGKDILRTRSVQADWELVLRTMYSVQIWIVVVGIYLGGQALLIWRAGSARQR